MGSRSYTFPRTRGHLPDSWACETPHAAHSEASQPDEQSVSCPPATPRGTVEVPHKQDGRCKLCSRDPLRWEGVTIVDSSPVNMDRMSSRYSALLQELGLQAYRPKR